jgi:hypothetical protein
MPIARYIIWVGASLLALLFIADWLVPNSNSEVAHEAFEVPPIRITSAQRPPESVFIDTNQSTIVPLPVPAEDVVRVAPSALDSYASVESPAVAIRADQKAPNSLKPIKKRVAAQKSSPVRTHLAAISSPTAPVQPARSLLDMVSGMGRNLFNLR